MSDVLKMRPKIKNPYVLLCLRNPGLNQKIQPWHVVLPCCLDSNENVLQYQQVLTSVSHKCTSIFLELARSLQNVVLILRTVILLRRLQTDDKPRGRFCILEMVRCCRDARTAGKVRSPRPDLGSWSRPVQLLCRGSEGRDEQKKEGAECQGTEEADFADADWSQVHPDWLMEPWLQPPGLQSLTQPSRPILSVTGSAAETRRERVFSPILSAHEVTCTNTATTWVRTGWQHHVASSGNISGSVWCLHSHKEQDKKIKRN